MLSIVPLKDANAAKSYYEKDNYYTKDSLECIGASAWHGKGAELLGLEGMIDKPTFEALLSGKLPNGERLGRIENNKFTHRPGYDLTFSAPKSISIMSEVVGDIRLQVAHDMAVKEALDYLEMNAIKTRSCRNSTIKFETVDNITAALFRHDTSRELDPQLHTHAVVMNAVLRSDGAWRSLSSEALFDHKMTAGMVYRAKLAYLAVEIGYEINKTHADGRFELTCVPEKLLTVFSKRREQIKQLLYESGASGSKLSEVAALQSRQEKHDVSRDNLIEKWGFEANEYIDSLRNIAASIHPFSHKHHEETTRAYTCVIHAINHLSEQESVFLKQDIVREALCFGLGNLTMSSIAPAIGKAQSQEILLPTQEDYYTTKAAKRLEKRCVKFMENQKNSVKPIAKSDAIDTYFASSSLNYTKGQMDAAKLILTTQDRFIAIQGDAGTGKTTLLKSVKTIAEAAGFELIGLSPQKEAALVLEEKAGIESMTVARFIVKNADLPAQSHNTSSPLLAILDEASMLSTHDMNELMKIAIAHNIRFAFVGDIKQLSSCNAGKPFWVLQQYGMQTAHMTDIVRQKSTGPGGHIRKAIAHIEAKEYDAALRYVEVRADEDRDHRLQKIAQSYLDYSAQGRENILVLIPRNTDRVEVNSLIRAGLKEQGDLTGDEMTTSVLVNQPLTHEKTLHASSYQRGDILQLNVSLKNMPSGAYFEVTSKNHQKNTLILHDNTGIKHSLDLNTLEKYKRNPISVYRHETRNLMVGDHIRWTKNHEGRVNGRTAEVIAIDHEQAIIKLHTGNQETLNLKTYQHWDYAFALTVHAAQGKDKHRVIAHMESFSDNLTHQNMLYTIVTRGEFQVTLVVDDKDACVHRLEKSSGHKLSALEYLGLIPDWKEAINEPMTVENPVFSSIPYTPKAQPFWDIELLQSRLIDHAESLVKNLLGEPNHALSTSHNLRYGNKGSLSITLQGQHAGTWKNFESGESGNLIQLIEARGYGFKEALDYAGSFVGLSPDIKREKPKEVAFVHADIQAAPNSNDMKAIAQARRIVLQSEPIHNTIAERYLHEHRAVTCESGANYRYHPALYEPTTQQKLPALLCIARDKAGDIHAAQAIYLDSSTAKKADIPINKRTYGRMRFGAGVTSGNDKSDHVYIAEGPETALSIQSAIPHAKVIAALSVANIAKIVLPENTQSVTICMDNDGDNAPSERSVEKAVNHFKTLGIQVNIAKPEKEGMDFNDVLKQNGISDIINILNTKQSAKINMEIIQQIEI